MDVKTLQLIRCANELSNRELAQRLASNPKTVQRWLTGYTSPPAIVGRLLDHELGDGTSGSALEQAKAKIRAAWRRFVMSCPAEELARVAAGGQAVEFDPDIVGLFELTHYEEFNFAQVYVGDTCGCAVESLEAVIRLLHTLGHEDDIDDIHDLIDGMEDDRLGTAIRPLVGAMERIAMLEFDIYEAVDEAMTMQIEADERSILEEAAHA